MRSIMEEYAILEAEIAERETKKAQLRPHILKMLVDDGVKNMKTAVGTFSVSTIKSWTYPEEVNEVISSFQNKVKELNDEIKATKAKAESMNYAVCEEKPQLKFTAIKL